MLRICRLSHCAVGREAQLHGALVRAISVHSANKQQQQQQQNNNQSSSLAAARERADVSTDVRPIGERIKENTKTASYLGVIVLGAAVTGGLLYAILRELWSSNSPNNVYSAALERCVNVSCLMMGDRGRIGELYVL